MTKTTVEIRRSEFEHRNPQHLVGKKAGRGYVGMFRIVVRWEVFADGEYQFTRNTRSLAKRIAVARWPGARISFESGKAVTR